MLETRPPRRVKNFFPEIASFLALALSSGLFFALVFLLAKGYSYTMVTDSFKDQATTASSVVTAMEGQGAVGTSQLQALLTGHVEAVALFYPNSTVGAGSSVLTGHVSKALLFAVGPERGASMVEQVAGRSYYFVAVPVKGGTLVEAFSLQSWQNFIEGLFAAVAGLWILLLVLAGALVLLMATWRNRERRWAVQLVAEMRRGGAPRALPTERLPELRAELEELIKTVKREGEKEAQVAGQLAHELKNHLTVLASLSELFRANLEKIPRELREVVELAEEEVVKLLNVSRDMMELARARSRAELSLAVCDAVKFVKAVADSAGVGSLVKVDPSAAGVLIEVDKRAIERALLNLISNAEKHGGGVKEIRVAVNGPTLLVTVRDEGPGIDFGGPKGSVEGSTGLGLAIASSLVARNGGSLLLSSAPTSGTSATLLIPLAS